MKSPNPHSGIYKADTSRTLDLNGGSPACNQGGVMILEPQDCGNQAHGAMVAAGFDGQMGAKAQGIGYAEEQAPTLKSGGGGTDVLIR